MIRIPSEGRWKVVNSGDKFGSVIRTKNISFDKDGVLALAKKAMVLWSKDDDNGFGNPVAVETDGSILYFPTSDGHMFRVVLTNNALTLDEVAATNQPNMGDWSDLVLFNDTMLVSGDTEVKYLNALGAGQTWNAAAAFSGLSASYPHPLCVRDRAQTLLVGDGNVIRQYSTAYVRDSANELTIPAQYIITCIRTVGSTIYVGTRHKYGGQAKLFLWNGTGLNNQAEYGCGADWIYSMTEYKSSVAIITAKGQLRRFNGGGFDELAQLPVYSTPYSWDSLSSNVSLIGKVASRGMRVDGDKLYINLDGSLNTTSLVYPGKYIPDQPSGLWCYDPNVGLYHKAGYNNNTKLELAYSDVASGYIVFSTPHQALTGDAFLNIGSNIGLTSGQVYYAIVAGPLSIRVALSVEDAALERAIAVSGTPVPGTDRAFFDRYESMGQTSINAPGGVVVLGRNFPNGFYGSEVVFGGSTIDDTMTAKGMVMSLGMGRNRGSFITPRIYASKAIDTYQKVLAMFSHMDLNTDSLVIKWRKLNKPSFPTPLFFSGYATWTSSTTFTVDTNLKAFGGVEVGDEVEVVEGAAGGYTAHITAIDDSTSTYIVTLDEEMPVSTGQFDFVVDNWKKLGSDINNENTPTALGADFAEKVIDSTGTWVQFKVELRGRNVMIDEMQSVNASLK